MWRSEVGREKASLPKHCELENLVAQRRRIENPGASRPAVILERCAYGSLTVGDEEFPTSNPSQWHAAGFAYASSICRMIRPVSDRILMIL